MTFSVAYVTAAWSLRHSDDVRPTLRAAIASARAARDRTSGYVVGNFVGPVKVGRR